MFSKPEGTCRQCTQSIKTLDKKQITNYTKIDVTEDQDGLNYVKELGYLQAPVFVVKNENGEIVKHWGGFRPDELDKLEVLLSA